MGNLDIFEGSDVVHTEGENFHLNVRIEIDFFKIVKVAKKFTWSRRRKTDISVRSAPL